MNIHYTTQFKKDYKRIKRQNKNPKKLENVIKLLLSGRELDSQYKDHPLIGNWKGHRDCHVEPDWLLIYRITSDDLYLERTGTHAELFRK
ncbi:MAG: type II toxin-antitoxin system YafQ family toxin [Thermodesulfobacteriota bacterium]|nr:type II toxin-antitoxin system YafQ family toxin [Thermodesulfobacteriota bacterium]